MAREKQPPPQDEDPGAPEWMVTFSDCMTLLLTFFVLLLTFSSFDEKVFTKLRVIYCDAFPTIHSGRQSSKESMQESASIKYVDEIDKGSDKPTFEDGSEGALKEMHDQDHKKHKVFLIESDEVFMGKGTVLTKQGKQTLLHLANFLKSVSGRVVISENRSKHSDQLGMDRSWAVIRHLTGKYKLDLDRFSLSAASTVGNDTFAMFELSGKGAQPDRILEIIILERSLYN